MHEAAPSLGWQSFLLGHQQQPWNFSTKTLVSLHRLVFKYLIECFALLEIEAEAKLFVSALTPFRTLFENGQEKTKYQKRKKRRGSLVAVIISRSPMKTAGKTLLESYAFLGNALVTMYCKCASVEDAGRVFDRMHERSVVSWTAMISGHVQQGHVKEGLKFFSQMQLTGMKPNQFTFATILSACSSGDFMDHGKQVHCHSVRTGFESNIFVGNALVTMYAECGSIESAKNVFDGMPKRDLVSCNAMIAGYTQHEHGEEALKLSCQILTAGMKPNQFTMASLLRACASLAALEQSMQVHSYIIKYGFNLDVFVGSALVDMYAKCGIVEYARQVFDKMRERNVVSWSGMIAGYALNENDEEALKLFWQALMAGVKPNDFTFSSIFRACANLTALQQGRQVHCLSIKSGFDLYTFVGSSLVGMYAKCGSIEDASQVFDKLPERNLAAWNAMIIGCAQHGRTKEALQLFSQIQLAGMKPNDITFLCVLSACSHAGLVDEGRLYFDSMSQDHGITPRAEHYACIVDLLGRSGHLQEADDFIKQMPFEPIASVWGALRGPEGEPS